MIPYWTGCLERAGVRFPWLGMLCQGFYRRVVLRERALGSISCADRILCIGGGPLPATALELARQTGAQVTVLERDPAAVASARQEIRRQGYENRIRVRCGDGLRVEPRGYTVIHIARQAAPWEAVLHHVLAQAGPGTRILARTPRGAGAGGETVLFSGNPPGMPSPVPEAMA